MDVPDPNLLFVKQGFKNIPLLSSQASIWSHHQSFPPPKSSIACPELGDYRELKFGMNLGQFGAPKPIFGTFPKHL